MTDRKGTFPETRSRAAPTVVSPRNKVNVALPFSRFTVEESVNMTVGTGSAWLGWPSRLPGSVLSSGTSSGPRMDRTRSSGH